MRFFLKKINLEDGNLSLSSYIGGLLRIIRYESGLSGEQLAKSINISQQQVSRYERGETGFQLDMLFRFLSALRMNESEKQYFFYQIVNKAREIPQYQFGKYE
ncbi:helix-turn-helix transcriptional regulator [Morganella morganii subsp. morganii]|nr:helix-turn-helix transcriptional regulator [Morganella morganii subsp. morganii]MBT0517255.1 helix-turn-helix transcriptional regulator [Morganella morganii subsp. morganii]